MSELSATTNTHYISLYVSLTYANFYFHCLTGPHLLQLKLVHKIEMMPLNCSYLIL